jgi:hypothetical protein
MIYVDEVTGLASVEAYGGVGLIATIVEVFAVVAVSKGGRGYIKKYQS